MRSTILLPLFLAGCQFVPGTDANAIRKAESAVSEKMADPDSVKFRNEHVVRFVHSVTVEMREGKVVPREPIVCGEVNAKNQFGAYVGFTPFSYQLRDPAVVKIYPKAITTNDDAMMVLDFPSDCLPKAR